MYVKNYEYITKEVRKVNKF